MAKVTRKKPNFKKFAPTTTDKDGYMVMPKNRNDEKTFSNEVQDLIKKIKAD